MKGYGETFFGKRIVAAHVERENLLQLRSWYARVPSYSNIADGPSRMDCALVTRLGGKQIMLPWERFLNGGWGIWRGGQEHVPNLQIKRRAS